MALCNYCGKFSFELLYHKEYRHQSSFEALRKSAGEGCPLCTLIHHTLSRRFKEQSMTPGQNSQIWIEKYPSEIGVLFGMEQELQCRAGVKEDLIRAGLDMVTSSNDPAADYIKARPIRPNPSDDEVFELIQQWLHECTSYHPYCRSKSAALPSRILDVGPADGSKEPRLFRTSGEYVKYLTLSYCWGSSRNVKTLTGNLDAHLKEIKYDSLPKTIRDAIDITRKLESQYLWVDALCIIQDSQEDWEIESPRMAEIYGNSFLTIAAESASDCSQGIFFNRTPRAGVKVPFFLEGQVRCGFVTLHDKWNYTTPPLHHRGWTFQEKELSRRFLGYGPEMLNYTCRNTQATENQGLFNTGTGIAKILRILAPPASLLEHMIPEDALSRWYKCAGEYSQRKLTNKADKLPAISGFAHDLEKVLGSSYRAGLWECDLIYGLLWQTSYRAPGSAVVSTRVPWRAPSWSWASLDEVISWDTLPTLTMRQQQSPRVVNLTATTHLLQKDLMGRVSGGTLTLDGSIKVARWVPKASIEAKPQIHISLLQYDEILLEIVVSDDQSKPSQGIEPSDSASRSFVRIFAVCRFDDDTDRPTHVWCLLLTSRPGPDHHSKPDGVGDALEVQIPDEWKSEQEQLERALRDEVDLEEQPNATDVPKLDVPLPVDKVTGLGRGIMLVPTNNDIHNEYRRVGYFELDGEPDDWPTDLIKVTIV